jgi:hypothetical protein
MTLAAAVMLAGCESREDFDQRRITVKVESVYLTSKTNSKVNLRDIKTGQLYENNRLSCSKTKAQNVKIGSLWDVTEKTYIYRKSNRFSTELVGTPAICDKSN